MTAGAAVVAGAFSAAFALPDLGDRSPADTPATSDTAGPASRSSTTTTPAPPSTRVPTSSGGALSAPAQAPTTTRRPARAVTGAT
jgi:hypothetical protein